MQSIVAHRTYGHKILETPEEGEVRRHRPLGEAYSEAAEPLIAGAK